MATYSQVPSGLNLKDLRQLIRLLFEPLKRAYLRVPPLLSDYVSDNKLLQPISKPLNAAYEAIRYVPATGTSLRRLESQLAT